MKLAFVGITLSSLPPLMAIARQQDNLDVVNYVDEGLRLLEKQKGGVDEELYQRMLSHLKTARSDGADGLLITCSMFTPFLDNLQKELDIPVIAADQAMMELAAQKGGKILLLVTNPRTVDVSTKLLQETIDASETDATLDTLLIDEAWDAVHRGKQEEHNRLIREAIEKNAADYDRIVLAQMSMAAAVLDYNPPIEVLTSPRIALETLKNILK